MQKYYISHPHCRFSLRILPSPLKGAKARAEDVVYAPSKSVQEAVQKAVGKDVAAACEWIDTSSAAYAEALAEDNVEADEDPIVLQAFLPRPTTDLAVICKKPTCTHFISVDSRSVSCARGTLKQIHTLYKSYLKSASPAPGLSDPFIYLNICCPSGSYDPNIEPAKDDVLFHDGDTVVRVVEKVLTRFYGELKTEEKTGKGKAVEVATLNGFELLLARKPATPANVVTPPSKKRWPKPFPTPQPAEGTGYDDVDEDEEEMAAMAVDMVMREEMGTSEFVASNSPSTSKQLPKEVEQRMDDGDQLMPSEDGPSLTGNGDLAEPEQTPAPPEPGTGAPASSMTAPGTGPLVTLRRKTTGWGFNMSGGLPDSDYDEPIDGGLGLHDSDNEETVRRDITLSNPWTAAKMNTPIVSSPISSSPASVKRAERLARRQVNPPTRTGNRRGSSPVSPENAARETPDALPTPASSPSARMFRENRGPVRLGKEPASGSVGLMSSWVSRTPRNPATSPPLLGFISAASLRKKQTTTQDDDGDDDGYGVEDQLQNPKRLTRAREPTKRSAPAPDLSKRRRLNDNTQTSFTPINNPAPTRSSPHRNRFLAATAALSTPSSHDPPPRQKRRRTKTLQPLDAIPEPSLQTHQLSQTIDLIASSRLKQLFKRLKESDAYVGGTTTGVATEVEGMFFSECAAWNDVTALGGLVKQWMLEVAEGGAEDLVEEVAVMEWGMEEGEEGERVLWAVGVGGELEE